MLCDAPSTFGRIVDRVFEDVKVKFVSPYLDDFTAYSSTFKDHSFHFEDVFNRIKQAGSKLKPSECFFGQNKTTFLGLKIFSHRTRREQSPRNTKFSRAMYITIS